MAELRVWPALLLQAPAVNADGESMHDAVSVLLDDLNLAAIEDLESVPIPANGLWDPTVPVQPTPPSRTLAWRVFFNRDDDRERAAAVLATQLSFVKVTSVDVPDEGWAARSQQSLHAVRAGTFIVAPPWDVPTNVEGATLIIIEPSMGFGTGHHPTTRLCLEALGRAGARGRTVLDVGTGSGVLAIGAALSGARTVRAVDADRDAIASAEINLSTNQVRDTVQLSLLDFRHHALEAADLVLANLTGGMLTSTADHVSSLVHPGGTLILSGFDCSEERAVRQAFGSWTPSARYEEEHWVAITMTCP